jgi:flagellar FliL protein
MHPSAGQVATGRFMTQAVGIQAGDTDAPAKKDRRKILVLVLPLLVGSMGAGLWFGGFLPGLRGGQEANPPAAGDRAEPVEPRAPVFMDLPEILTNLSTTGRRATFIRLRSKLEIAKPEDAVAIQAAMPRLQDLFQTYLREMRPEELRGSQGTYRLREELRARANIAVHPVRVLDVLFVEMIVQ